jgi:hypothetical protein
MKRNVPRLVRVEIIEQVKRLAGRAMTGVLPRGAKLRPSVAWLDRPVSSPQWISAPSAWARLAMVGYACSSQRRTSGSRRSVARLRGRCGVKRQRRK